jgi:hypothetical protein
MSGRQGCDSPAFCLVFCHQAGSPKRPGRDSTGIWLLVFFSEMASVGQFTAQTPHPMQKSRSIIILSPVSSSPRLITSRGHISTQVSHRVHSSWSITGSKLVLAAPPLYPKSLIACSEPQQHEQQFQMKDDGFCIFNVECTKPASAAFLNTSIAPS